MPKSSVRPSRGHIRASRMHIFYRPVPGRPLKPSEHTLPPIGEYEKSPPGQAWGYQTSRSPHVVRPKIISRALVFSGRGGLFSAPCQGAGRGAADPCACPPPVGKRIARIQQPAQPRAEFFQPHPHFLPPRAVSPAQAFRPARERLLSPRAPRASFLALGPEHRAAGVVRVVAESCIAFASWADSSWRSGIVIGRRSKSVSGRMSRPSPGTHHAPRQGGHAPVHDRYGGGIRARCVILPASCWVLGREGPRALSYICVLLYRRRCGSWLFFFIVARADRS